MKKISILIPCYNEEENVIPIANAIVEEMGKNLADYDYEIIFIDNDSKDNTRPLLREICKRNPKVKAIFNAKNFGQFNSPYYGMLQTTGDCTILVCCDFQDPIEMIPQIIAEWEKGARIVSCIKTASKENRIMRFLRTCYYKIIKKMSDVDQIEHFTGFGLYDRSFLDILRELNDPIPFMKGYVAEFCGHPYVIKYKQPKRQKGKSWGSFLRLYDVAMVGITGYTKIGIRAAVFFGFLTSVLSFIMAIVYLVYKLTHWYSFNAGVAPLVVGMFFISGVQMFFLGMMGEYILSVNERIRRRPLVIEKTRLNFEEEA